VSFTEWQNEQEWKHLDKGGKMSKEKETKQTTRCPVNQAGDCLLKMCAWYDQQQGMCSILLIARSLDDFSHEGINCYNKEG